MAEDPRVLDFVKAVSDADRLRVIGVLAQHPASVRDVADELGIPFREAFGHLGMLEFAGVVLKTGDVFSLREDALEALSKQQFASERHSYIPAPELEAKSRKVLATFLNADGTLKQVPPQGEKLQIVLEYLSQAFEPGAQYTEKEVNELLRRFYSDPVTLRRGLIDAGLLRRESDGSRYWRPSNKK